MFGNRVQLTARRLKHVWMVAVAVCRFSSGLFSPPVHVSMWPSCPLTLRQRTQAAESRCTAAPHHPSAQLMEQEHRHNDGMRREAAFQSCHRWSLASCTREINQALISFCFYKFKLKKRFMHRLAWMCSSYFLVFMLPRFDRFQRRCSVSLLCWCL